MIPRLHLVTDDRILARSDFLPEAERLMVAARNALAFHLRGPHTRGRDLHRLALELRAVAAGVGTTFLVNDRVDVALAVEADGVHLGRRSLAPSAVRPLLRGERALVGSSCHDGPEAREAAGERADYLFVGAVYPTPSHPAAEGAGPGLVTEVRSAVSVPLLGIGGIKVDDVEELLEAGAYGVAVIRGIWDAADPVGALSAYLRALPIAEGSDSC